MKHKILFVDDEASLRRTMIVGLTQNGYDTEPCENGMTALKKLDTYMKNNIPLSAIVLDIHLPDIDGIKLVKIIRYKYPVIPLMLITGYADRYHREVIRNLKINAFLEKPFTPDELVDQISRIVEKEKEEEPSAPEEKIAIKSESAYMLVSLNNTASIFESYKSLYQMKNVLYCDATKGDYDVFILAQSNKMDGLRNMSEKIKGFPFVKSVDFMELESPLLDESTTSIINSAEDALSFETSTAGKTRDMGNRVYSYVLIEAEREKMDEIYPTLRLNENVVYCDYTTGKYNLVLFVTGNYFDEIDKFIQQTIVNMSGVLKVKEYPVVNLFEM
jgi:two-component system, chemotaxis family, chemotaxis protein CheY